MARQIEVQGAKYPLIENMGFNHSVGMYAAVVRSTAGEHVVVRHRGGPWRFWSPADRVAPLREAAAHGWPKPKLQGSTLCEPEE